LVTITGTGLTGATLVDFGTNAATDVTVVNSTTITADSPAGSGVADVTVTTPGGKSATSSADEFTYIVAPAVTGVSPASGPAAGGKLVTITGTGLTGATVVDFGTTAATGVTVVSSTKITADSPSGSGVVDVTVITPGGTSATSSADDFTYIGAPAVTGVSPSSGPAAGNTLVTITGSGFSGATVVDFGTTAGTDLVIVSSTKITADSPAGTGAVDVTVTTPSGTSATSSADDFTYVSFQTVTLSGEVFDDQNGDGTIDPGDLGFSGWTVNLLNSQHQVTATTTTNSSGGYSFTGVGPGAQTIQEVPQTGPGGVPFIPTIPSTGTIAITPASGVNQPGLNFGNILQPAVADVRIDWGSQSMSILKLNRDLPFVDINAIDVIFNENVSVTQGDLALTTLINSGKTYNFTGFSYNPTTHDAKWTLPTDIGVDSLMMNLDGHSSSSGTAGVHVPPSIYLGDYTQDFQVLPGDVNGDGVVNSGDMYTVQTEMLGITPYSVWADVAGAGTITTADYNDVRKWIGSSLP
jgi:hypothetical protein